MSASLPHHQWNHPTFQYVEAATVEEACQLLERHGERARLIAGGTDLLVAMRRGKIACDCVVNVKTIPNLDRIAHEGEILKIGALTTLDEIARSSSIKGLFPAVSASAGLVGTQQIRNTGTIGGNLCNAAPSADMAPSLIALGAQAVLAGTQGERTVLVEEFFSGPGLTVLQPDEMLIEIQVPDPPPASGCAYLKLRPRTAIDLAVVGVAVAATRVSPGTISKDARIVLGAVAPTPMRARKAEEVLNGNPLSAEILDRVSQAAADEARPISDVRASASYRRHMVKVITRQALDQVFFND